MKEPTLVKLTPVINNQETVPWNPNRSGSGGKVVQICTPQTLPKDDWCDYCFKGLQRGYIEVTTRDYQGKSFCNWGCKNNFETNGFKGKTLFNFEECGE